MYIYRLDLIFKKLFITHDEYQCIAVKEKTSIHMLNTVDNVRDIKLPLLLNRLLKMCKNVHMCTTLKKRYEQKMNFHCADALPDC